MFFAFWKRANDEVFFVLPLFQGTASCFYWIYPYLGLYLCVYMCLTQCLHAEAPFFTHNRRITGNPTGLFLFSYLNGWLNVMVHGISRYILRLVLLGSRVVRYQLLPQITCMYVCTILYFAKHTHVYIIYILYMCVLCKINKCIYIYIYIYSIDRDLNMTKQLTYAKTHIHHTHPYTSISENLDTSFGKWIFGWFSDHWSPG